MVESNLPPVVAVVVACDPGPWFDDCLAALAAQDYGPLAVLVVDNASGHPDGVRSRVDAVLPDAAVRRVDVDRGYGAAANLATELVEGASFYLFCHDDAVLAPDAVSALVAEAVRSNGGVLGPKLVDWSDPRRLLSAGVAVDRTGAVVSLVERGELDQEQHDRVRDVFFVEGAATLVRADLFEAVGGYDEEITYLGDDLDLCWRAHVAGARVLVAPDARARHVEALGQRRPTDDRRRLRGRHRVRSLLGNTGRLRLLWVVPLAVAITLVETVYALILLRPGHAADLVSAWTWNLRRPASLLRKRRRVAAARKVTDGELADLQVGGSARLREAVRGQLAGAGRLGGLGDAGRAVAASVRQGPQRSAVLAWLVIVVVAAFGSRHLVTRGIPVHGELLGFPDPGALLRDFVLGRRPSGLGTDQATPTASGLLGLAGQLSLGRTAGLRTLLVVGLLPVGWLGAWRLGGPLGTRPGRVAVLVTYAVLPLPFDALALGSWTALLAWAVAPHVVVSLARLSGVAPFDPGPSTRADGTGPSRLRAVVRLGLLLALAAAFAPVVLAGTVVLAVGLALGGLVVGRAAGAGRLVGAAAGAVAVAVVLHLPWVIGLASGGVPARQLLGRGTAATADGWGALLRFDLAEHGHVVLGWGFVVAATVPILVGRGWRLEWAARAWVTMLLSVGLAWVAGRSFGDVPLPEPVVVLAAAGPVLALAVGLGVTAFQRDLPDYRFGLPQAAVVLGTVGLAMAALPVVGGAADGRWGVPRNDLGSAFPFLSDDVPGGQRILWIGDPAVLPAAGWSLTDATGFTTSDDGPPDLRVLYPAPLGPATDPIGDALRSAVEGGSARLGAALAGSGVRYVVAVEQAAPSFTDTPVRPLPDRVADALDRQLDLRRIPTDDAVLIWSNEAAVPIEAALDAATTDALLAGTVRPEDGLGDPEPLGDRLGAGQGAYLARGSDRFEVSVAGRPLDSRRVGPGGLLFDGPEAGPVDVTVDADLVRIGLLVAQLLLVLAAWRVAVGGDRDRTPPPRRRGEGPVLDVRPVPPDLGVPVG